MVRLPEAATRTVLASMGKVRSAPLAAPRLCALALNFKAAVRLIRVPPAPPEPAGRT